MKNLLSSVDVTIVLGTCLVKVKRTDRTRELKGKK